MTTAPGALEKSQKIGVLYSEAPVPRNVQLRPLTQNMEPALVCWVDVNGCTSPVRFICHIMSHHVLKDKLDMLGNMWSELLSHLQRRLFQPIMLEP